MRFKSGLSEAGGGTEQGREARMIMNATSFWQPSNAEPAELLQCRAPSHDPCAFASEGGTPLKVPPSVQVSLRKTVPKIAKTPSDRSEKNCFPSSHTGARRDFRDSGAPSGVPATRPERSAEGPRRVGGGSAGGSAEGPRRVGGRSAGGRGRAGATKSRRRGRNFAQKPRLALMVYVRDRPRGPKRHGSPVTSFRPPRAAELGNRP